KVSKLETVNVIEFTKECFPSPRGPLDNAKLFCDSSLECSKLVFVEAEFLCSWPLVQPQWGKVYVPSSSQFHCYWIGSCSQILRRSYVYGCLNNKFVHWKFGEFQLLQSLQSVPTTRILQLGKGIG